MGQDLSQFTENVPSLVKDTLRRMGQEVAMDLHEGSMQVLFDNGDDDDDVKQEEEMAQRMTTVSPLYVGIWQDDKGRPFYYDVQHQAYFFLENHRVAAPPQPHVLTTTTNEKSSHDNNAEEEEEEEQQRSCASSSSSNITTTTTTTTPRSVSRFRFITDKIAADLQIIYSNVTHSVSMMLERGEGLEQTREKLNRMMEATSSLERQSRCLSCAHRCNAIWPGTGFTFILKIADMIPMSACCQDDGMCGPYVFMSEDDEEDVGDDDDPDHGINMNGFETEISNSNLADHHLD